MSRGQEKINNPIKQPISKYLLLIKAVLYINKTHHYVNKINIITNKKITAPPIFIRGAVSKRYLLLRIVIQIGHHGADRGLEYAVMNPVQRIFTGA